MSDRNKIAEFICESNAIEGIYGDPGDELLEAATSFLALPSLTVGDVANLVSVMQPGATLRAHVGMDVRVGSHIALAVQTGNLIN